MDGTLLDNFHTSTEYYYSFILKEPLVSPYILQLSYTRRCPLRCKMCKVASSKIKGRCQQKGLKI